MLRTKFDLNVEGHYRIRVYGRDFIKNRTDVLRVYFDIDGSDTGPEYAFSWCLGRNPGRPVRHTALEQIDGWDHGSQTRVLCPGLRHQVNYARDDRLVLTKALKGSRIVCRVTGSAAGLDPLKTRTLASPKVKK